MNKQIGKPQATRQNALEIDYENYVIFQYNIQMSSLNQPISNSTSWKILSNNFSFSLFTGKKGEKWRACPGYNDCQKIRLELQIVKMN